MEVRDAGRVLPLCNHDTANFCWCICYPSTSDVIVSTYMRVEMRVKMSARTSKAVSRGHRRRD
jgi:hypothetical protein